MGCRIGFIEKNEWKCRTDDETIGALLHRIERMCELVGLGGGECEWRIVDENGSMVQVQEIKYRGGRIRKAG